MTNPGFGNHILPTSSTGLERALVDVDSARVTEINAELIRDIWDPVKCPIRLLPYLAWAFGVQYWNNDWSETTKRSWVASQLVFKSIRGTEGAMRMVVDFAGRDVSRWGYKVGKVTTQPQRIFSGPSLTKAQREEWLQRLPQVRVWRTREQGTATIAKAFYGGKGAIRQHSYRFCFISGHLPIVPDVTIISPVLGAPALVPEGPCSLWNNSPVLGSPIFVVN